MLVEVRIEDAVWNVASEERRREWRILIAELIEHNPVDGAEQTRLFIADGNASDTILTLERLDGTAAMRVVVPGHALAPERDEFRFAQAIADLVPAPSPPVGEGSSVSQHGNSGEGSDPSPIRVC